MDNFVYMDISQINPDLICEICDKPFVNPVSLPFPCEKTFCLQCIQSNIQNHRDHCSSCQDQSLTNEHFQPEGPKFRKILDKLLVQCSLCQQTNIQRVKFIEHYNQSCPKRIVSCSAKDINCQWTGTFDQLNEHTNTCPYEQIRPHLIKLIQENQILKQTQQQLQTINNNQQNIDEQMKLSEQIQNENKQLKQSFDEQIKSFQQLNGRIKLLQQQNEELKQQNDSFNELTIQSQQLQNQNEHLKEQLQQNSTQINLFNEQILHLKHFQDQCQNLIEENNFLKTNSEQIQNQFETLEQSYQDSERLKSDNEQFRQLLQRQSSQIDSFHSRYEQLNNEYEQLNNEYETIFQLSQQQQIQLSRFEQQDQIYQEEILHQQFQIQFKDNQIKQLQGDTHLQLQGIQFIFINKISTIFF